MLERKELTCTLLGPRSDEISYNLSRLAAVLLT
jgi:hypothetical protein